MPRFQSLEFLLWAFFFTVMCRTAVADEEPNIQDASRQVAKASSDGFELLFPDSEALHHWVVTQWDDVSKPAEEATEWTVRDGVLYGSDPRGTWLMSKREYANFELHFEFKLGERGNGGVAFRTPLKGDPAFDGMELQMADVRYNPEAKDSELTGGIYRAIAPAEQVYKPTEWNRYEIRLIGSHLHVRLNGVVIHDTDLGTHHEKVLRHDGSEASPISDRPHRGHLGFQELSRGGSQVQIRNARICVLPN